MSTIKRTYSMMIHTITMLPRDFGDNKELEKASVGSSSIIVSNGRTVTDSYSIEKALILNNHFYCFHP